MMTPRELEEYRALRATIRERGTTRVWVLLAGLLGWAALVIATAALASLPIATLLPLLILNVVFEIATGIRAGVERIGRYIQVYFEPSTDPSDQTAPSDAADAQGSFESRQWEHVVMDFGRAFPGSGTDRAFPLVFSAATLLNFIPVLLTEPARIEIAVAGSFHLLFLLRIFLAHRAAASQRAQDLDRFVKLRKTH
jgi:hypothetical protein